MSRITIKPMGVWKSLAIYIPAFVLVILETWYLIPFLHKNYGVENILLWFIVAGLGVFTPLIITGLLILKSEGYKFNNSAFKERLRFKKLKLVDIIWSLSGLVSVSILSVLIIKLVAIITGEFNSTPGFMSMEPLSEGRYWILLIWFPYWLLNILGEEFLWRGIMFPRQEVAFGKYTWIVHGTGWGLFHIAFGWKLLITLLPMIYIQSYIVQKTKNSWVGIIMHGLVNGPSFIAISLGLI